MPDTSPANEEPNRLPDLYRLLSLEPLEQDVGKIAHTIKQLRARIEKESQAEMPARRAAKLLALAQHHLLSGARKQSYDQAWSRAHSSRFVELPSQTAWDLGRLERWLPSGDPYEPFHVADFLKLATGTPQADQEADFAELQMFLSTPPKQHTVNLAPTNQPATGPIKHPASVPEATKAAVTGTRPRTTQLLEQSTSPIPPALKAITRSMRKRRAPPILLAGLGTLASLAIVLGLIYFLTGPRNPAPAGGSVTNAAISVATPTHAAATVPTPLFDSGLPSVPGFSNDDGLVGLRPPDGQMAWEQEAIGSDPITPSAESKQSAATKLPAGSQSLGNDLPAEPPTDAERSAWLSAVNDIKQWLGQQQYAIASSKLEQLFREAQLPQQKRELVRLQAIAKLARELAESIEDSISVLQAGETFTIGSSTQAAFVEGNAQQIVVRIRGENQTFALTSMPIGLAYSLADLKLSKEDATTKAQKAAFTILHPAAMNNDLARQRARDMMSEAIAAGVVGEDLRAAFDD